MTDNMADSDRHRDQWVSIPEAAALLGKSARTVRRYVTKGRLEADRSKTPMLVNVSDMMTDTGGQMADTGGQMADTCRSSVQELTETIEQLEAEAEDLRRKVDRLALDNAALNAQNELLEQLLEEVASDRDYLRQAHAVALSKIPDSKPGLWRRLLPWRGRDDN